MRLYCIIRTIDTARSISIKNIFGSKTFLANVVTLKKMDIVSWVTNAIFNMMKQDSKNKNLVKIKASLVNVEETDAVVNKEASKTKDIK